MHGSGGTLRAEVHRVCVVYDGASGSVVHVHHDITLPGGTSATEEEMEHAAVAQLQKRGRDRPGLEYLHVSAEEVQNRAGYSVDPLRKVLVQ